MQKKLVTLIAVVVMAIMLAGCNKQETSQGTSVTTDSQQTAEVTTTATVEAQHSAGESYFDGKIADIDDLTIEITDYKLIEPGQAGNEYGKEPVIAFWYKVTNKTDKEIDATMAWFAVFNAIQDNDPNSVNNLEVGMSPDNDLNDKAFDNIKKGGTVEAAIAYKLTDTETPVTLKATKGVFGEDIGEATYKLNK